MIKSRKKLQTTYNLIMNIFAFAVQFIISFYVSPIIVESVGATAYGFIGLANDFTAYAAVLATIFNSVAARFIANSYYKGDYEQANSYFNSLVITNLVIAGIFGILGIILVPNLDVVLNIPIAIVVDVKITFALIFGAYIISLSTLVFSTSTFVTNRTDIQGIRNIVQYIIRFSLIIIFLNFISIHIYWIALATLIATLVVAIMNVNLTKKLTPEIIINRKYAKKEYVVELARSGSWMAFSSISTILLRGLDLTITDVMLGHYDMGLLSIARTMPNNITTIIATIAPIFTPVFLAYYANGNIVELVGSIKKSIKTMALILFVPISVFIVFSFDFYSLWQKSLTVQELSIVTFLSCLTVVQEYFNATTATMAQISVVTNKIKIPACVSLVCGIIGLVLEIILIKYTKLGVYAVVVSTSVVLIIRYILFNSIYAARCLKQSPKCFFFTVVKVWITIPILLLLSWGVRWVLPVLSWGALFVDIGICVVIGYVIMICLYGRDKIRKAVLKRS